MAYRNYNRFHRFFRWLWGIQDPDDFEKADRVHDGDGPIEISHIKSDFAYLPRHKITVNPDTVLPGMGIPDGALVYKVICNNAPVSQPCPVYNVYAGFRGPGEHDQAPTDMDYLAIAMDMIARDLENCFEIPIDSQLTREALELIILAQEKLAQHDQIRCATFTFKALETK